MQASRADKDIELVLEDKVATVTICRPPHNFFDELLLADLADTIEALDEDDDCRAVVLASQGKSFCAGARLSAKAEGDGSAGDDDPQNSGPARVYRQAIRLFRTRKPIVAAVQGPAVGGGLGLALSADLRVACVESRFCANFTQLGFHPGFGLSVTLPRLIGPSAAARMFYTSCRIKGDEAFRIGLADFLVSRDELVAAARAVAEEIARTAPLAVQSTRATLRDGLADEIEAALSRELSEQLRLRKTEDFAEGVRASAERRTAVFRGR